MLLRSIFYHLFISADHFFPNGLGDTDDNPYQNSQGVICSSKKRVKKTIHIESTVKPSAKWLFLLLQSHSLLLFQLF